MITHGLRSLLLADAGIAALVGQRVYVNQAAQTAALPYIVITQIDLDPMLALDGTYGMQSAEIDVDCYGMNHVTAAAVAAAVKAKLNDYSGAAGDDDMIDAVLLLDENDGPLAPNDGTQTGRHLVTVEYEVQFTPN
jgi:hypothetical protein